ncbi:MAG: glycosyltransferase [Bacteroidales bacterium]|nr:glycosyltransferase [Bacteroidales bacterium]
MDINLSLIIPVYNAESFILDVLISLTEWKKKNNFSVQIILVNDGSSDLTDSIVDSYIKTKDSSIEMISYKLNRGKGYAVRTGMLAAKGKYRIYTDADIPFGFEVFNKMQYYLDFKEFDVVIGDRTLPGSSYITEIPQIRKAGSIIYSFIVGRFVAGGHFDTQCGIKGFRAETANDLFSVSKINGFAFDVELLYVSLKRNYDIKRLPVVLISQKGSSVKVLRHGFGMFIDLFRMKWNQLSGKYKKQK